MIIFLKNLFIMNNSETISYLAGFFDGEGSVYIMKGKNSQGNPAFFLEISFTNSNREVLEYAQSLFKGKITESKDPRPLKKMVYRLRIRSNQALDALKQMLPFLKVKKEQAKMGIKFQELLKQGSNIRFLSIEKCQNFKDLITALNDKSPMLKIQRKIDN